MFGLLLLIGVIQSFLYPPCRRRPWPCGWLPSACRPPCYEGFPQMRFSSWYESNSSWSSDTWIWWMPRIFHGLDLQWLRGGALVGQIPSGHFRSWIQVWSPRVSWLTHLSVWLWSSMASCRSSQINRKHRGGGVSDIDELPDYYPPLG